MKEPDEDDWGKLKHCLDYLKGTLYMKRHMKTDSLSMIRWWVDASYGVHWDCKDHTGAMMSMGKGVAVNISRKHKLNTSSSTEAELVSIADVLGMMMLTNYASVELPVFSLCFLDILTAAPFPINIIAPV